MFGIKKDPEPVEPSLPETVTIEKFYTKHSLPAFSSGELKGVYVSSDDTEICRFENTKEEDFNTYISMLRKDGYTVYAHNEIDTNLFATLYNDKNIVTVSRYSKTATFRIIAEPKGALYPIEDKNDGEFDTLITGVKGETVVASEGMGFVIRLKDGSFCIIDGGMGDPDHVDSDKLMNILNAQKPADVEKPVIAAWIFTHLHGDHIGVFNCFSLDHHDDVVIENFYYNFPRVEEIAASDSPYMLDDSIYRFNQFKKNLSEFYSYVPSVKLHSGNKFEVRNASFEVLYAYDDMYPFTILNGGMNENSMLIKMTVDGQSVMWTGDFAFGATDLVLHEYDNALSADILQLPHHGMNGTIPLYKAIAPTYVFLPVWENGHLYMYGLEQNQWLINNPAMKQIISTSCGTWTLKFPYSPDENKIERIPSEQTVNVSYPSLMG